MNANGQYLIGEWVYPVQSDYTQSSVSGKVYAKTIKYEVYLYAWDRGNAFLACTCPEQSDLTPQTRVKTSCTHTRQAELKYTQTILGYLEKHWAKSLTNATIYEFKSYNGQSTPPLVFGKPLGIPAEQTLKRGEEPVLTADVLEAALGKKSTTIKEQKQAKQDANLREIERGFYTLERRLRAQEIPTEIVDKVKQVALNLGKQGTLARNIEVIVDKLNNVKVRAKDKDGQVIYAYDTRSDYDKRRTIFMDMVDMVNDPIGESERPSPESDSPAEKKDRFDYLEL